MAALLAASAMACGSPAETDATGGVDRATAAVSLDIDALETSASGLSSGAYMAVQFHVAFSSTMRGVAAFAGGPYGCAQGSLSTATSTCMSSSAKLDPAPFVALTKSSAASGAIDGVEHLKGQRVFLFGGAKDSTVNPAVMDGLQAYYASFVGASDLAFVRQRASTAHTMPTESFGSDCATTSTPFLGKCGYDGAGAALEHIYGALAPRPASLSGTFVAIPQAHFVDSPAAHSLGDTAYAYVPRSCSDGERCKVHVAFHGCKQSVSAVGDTFYKHAGYNEWADTNHIVVLYPQTIAKSGNPNGCWDWFGYDSADYAKKTGPQMKMAKAMVEGLVSGAIGVTTGGGAPADAGVPDAADAGVPDATKPDPSAPCAVSSSAEHVAAGRARDFFGLAYAAGSSQRLGFTSSPLQVSLRRLGPGMYVVGACR